jgi:hypothetical protein
MPMTLGALLVALLVAALLAERAVSAPTVSFPNLPARVRGADFSVTVLFSTDVGGFTASGISCVDCEALVDFAGSGSIYSITVRPGAEGVKTLSVAAGAARDVADTPNAGYSQNFEVDTTRPTISWTGFPVLSRVAPHTVSVTVSEASNLQTSHFTCVGCTVGTLIPQSATTFTLSVSLTAQGQVTLSVAAGAFADDVGNTNAIGFSTVGTFDTMGPSASFSGFPSGQRVNDPSYSVTVTLSADTDPSTVLASSFVCTRCSISNFVAGVPTTTFEVTITSEGQVTVATATNGFRDLAGNSNTASSVSCVYDVTFGLATITGLPQFSKLYSFNIAVQYPEVVTDFTAADLVLPLGCTQNSFLQVNGSRYTFSLVCTTNGTKTVSIEANSLFDEAGNGNQAQQMSTTIDVTKPSIVRVQIPPDYLYHGTRTGTVTVYFNEPLVAAPTAANFTVGNGQINAITGSGSTYFISVYHTVTSATWYYVTLALKAGSVFDAAGNTNDLSTTYNTIRYQNSYPVPKFVSGGAAFSNTNPITVVMHVKWYKSNAVYNAAGFAAGEFTCAVLTGAGSCSTATFFAVNASDYTLTTTLTATNGGPTTFRFSIPSNALTVTSRPGRFDMVVDKVVPSVASVTFNTPLAQAYSNLDTARVGVNFNEGVMGVTASDFTCTPNCAVATVETETGTTVPIHVQFFTAGDKTVTLPASRYTDYAGNLNTAAYSFTIGYDLTAPTCTYYGCVGYTAVSSCSFTLSCSEPVSGVTATDFTVTSGATVGTPSPSSGYAVNFTIPVTFSTNGAKALTLKVSSVVDRANNLNALSFTSHTITYDTVAPAIVSMFGFPTGGTNVNVHYCNVTTSEPVLGLVAADFVCSGCTLSDFQGSNSFYTFTATLTTQGSVSISIAATKFTDLAGNNNAASFSVTGGKYDIGRPTVVLGNLARSNALTQTASFTFSEVVQGFLNSRVLCDPVCTVSGLTGNGTHFTATLSDLVPDVYINVSIADGSVQDLAGN